MQVTRRQFFRICTAGVGGSSLAALGFAPGEALAEVRAFKLARATETRNTCPYCSVGCGVLMYSLGDKSKNAHTEIIHIEGDPDHPVNRGTLCPKGAGLLDFVHSPNRLQVPGVSRARQQGMAAHLLGRRVQPHRQADEGRPRHELHRDRRQGRTDGQPLDHHRLPGRFGLAATKPAT